MLQRLKNLLATPAALRPRHDDLQLAAAGLLVEAAQLDGTLDPTERQSIGRLLEQRFSLTAAESAELLEAAELRSADAVDIFGYTRVLARGFSQEEKIQLIEMIWEVVYADGVLHEHEASLLRRVGELVYVSDRDRGEARKRVLARLGRTG